MEGHIQSETELLRQRLRQAEAALAEAREELERGVELRTAELRGINERLKLELSERGRIEEELLKERQDWKELAPGHPYFSAEAFMLAGIPAVTFGTANDARPLVNTPLDLPEAMDFDRLARQVELLCRSLTGTFRYTEAMHVRQVNATLVQRLGR